MDKRLPPLLPLVRMDPADYLEEERRHRRRMAMEEEMRSRRGLGSLLMSLTFLAAVGLGTLWMLSHLLD